MADRAAPEVETLWGNFHRLVNMTSEELRGWLPYAASDEHILESDPTLPELGRKIVKILGKRKVDLTDEDLDTMRRVIDETCRRLEHPPGRGAAHDGWRRSLMTLGHDPLRPDPHGSEDLP